MIVQCNGQVERQQELGRQERRQRKGVAAVDEAGKQEGTEQQHRVGDDLGEVELQPALFEGARGTARRQSGLGRVGRNSRRQIHRLKQNPRAWLMPRRYTYFAGAVRGD